jgi:hypothetical protein
MVDYRDKKHQSRKIYENKLLDDWSKEYPKKFGVKEEEKKDANDSEISYYAHEKMVAKLKHDYEVFVNKLD